MAYKVVVRTKSFNKPGLSPTEKNGSDMGWVEVGFTFETQNNINGWLAIASNKWVMLSACQLVTVTPPPVDPPVDPPPADPADYEIIEMTRRSLDGGLTWSEYEYWGRRRLP